MSYGSPSLENDIRSRALAEAEVLAATGNAERYDAVRKHFQEQVSAARLPPTRRKRSRRWKMSGRRTTS